MGEGEDHSCDWRVDAAQHPHRVGCDVVFLIKSVIGISFILAVPGQKIPFPGS